MRDEIFARVQQAQGFNKFGLVAAATAVLPAPGTKPKISLENLPAAFLFYNGQSAAPVSDRPGSVNQLVTDQWGLILVTRSLNDASGERSADQIDELVTSIDQQLLGFEPTGATKSMRKARNAGRLLRWDRDLYYFQLNWDVDKRLCKH